MINNNFFHGDVIRLLAIISIVLFLGISLFSSAETYTTRFEYQYDDECQLTHVDYQVEAHGKPLRTLYSTIYNYDENGNRLGMSKQAGVPEIDEVLEVDHLGTAVALKIEGFAFQQGALVTLDFGGGQTCTGTITDITALQAIVEFDCGIWPNDNPTVIVEMPDGQTTSQGFSRSQYMVQINIQGPGTVLISPEPPYYINDIVTLTAIPDSGTDVFDGWSGDAAGFTLTTDVVLDMDKTVIATFRSTLPLVQPLGLVALFTLLLTGGILLIRKRSSTGAK